MGYISILYKLPSFMYTLLYIRSFLYLKLDMYIPRAESKSHLYITRNKVTKQIRLSSNDEFNDKKVLEVLYYKSC